ncbi:hypothetical protein [Alistipes sp. ZOR0009]|uniref:hypothetical protein n=1 Tax=Alistipes sp. ZOR0009 TaxID=1339253 RepID=UPI000648EE3C|nr:hypothetical protein [Alistipes sp. ZOR0009]
MSNESLSLFRLENSIKSEFVPFDAKTIKKNIPSFSINETLNTKYVQPLFSELISNVPQGNQPKVILISAAGATGKSELTNYLSASLKMPIFNLSNHNPVASNSLTGLFFDCLGHIELGKFVEKLKTGQSTLIIDALDEGYIKTTVQGFNSFLDGIVEISSDSKGTPFILLGRTQVMEHCMFYFDDKNIDAKLLSIEPFTVDQAKEFIDKQINEQRYIQQYKDLRDFIIQSVEGFFQSQSEVNKKQYKSFIGYAPVLLSITKLLQKESNYKGLFEELSQKEDKGIDLIISIVEYILQRDKEEKIKQQLLPNLLKHRDEMFCELVNDKAYSIDEQCARLLHLQLTKSFSISLTEDAQFNGQYEEKIADWIKEHPFLEGSKIQNAVFESYIIARLILNPIYKESVYEYLKLKYKDAFMLFFIYHKLDSAKNIESSFFPYLYSSLKSLDDKFAYSSINIEEKSCSDEHVICDVEFELSDREDQYNFEMFVDKNTDLYLGNSISNASINSPINILLDGNRCELISPVTINCHRIIINSSEFIIEKGIKDSVGVIFECDECKIDYSKGQNPTVLNHLNENQKFQIISLERPEFPFSDNFLNSDTLTKLDPMLKEKYLKLRKIIVLFRSHSKGRMGRFKEKIEDERVTGYSVGKKVLAALIKSKVLYLEGTQYFIDPTKIHEQLGVSYNEIRLRVINEKTIEFLKTIEN